MGFLKVKTETYNWEESIEFQEQIKNYGIQQGINLFNTFKGLNKKMDELKWGEEIEYEVVTRDSRDGGIKIHSEGFQLISRELQKANVEGFIYQEEFGSWMVEAVPDKPYKVYDVNASIDALHSLIKRRDKINEEVFCLGILITSLASFPNLGTKDSFVSEDEENYETEDYEKHNIFTQSKYVLDEFTNPHPRFNTMMQNIRQRRGKKVDIQVPLYPDVNTGVGKIDGDITPGSIYMDSQHFGMGCCCLQITYEAQNLEHAKFLHDSFIPLGPIFGALSASAPIYKGQLANIDFRWNVIRDSVDSRTDEEKDPNSSNHVPKSRYSAKNHYISDHPFFANENLNDGAKVNVNREYIYRLKEEGMSDRLAYHFASLFVPDALVIYKGHTDYDETMTDHFENLNSTNWNSVRFKPPPSLDSSIGWRVEFRTMDVQITDYENAALIALMNLTVRILNEFSVDVSLPISLSDINMERAHQVDAVTSQKFWFRKHIVKGDDHTKNPIARESWQTKAETCHESLESEFVELTVLDILVGNPEVGNTGLFALFEEYMSLKKFPEETIHYYSIMLGFLEKRARGEVKTGARFMRDFVLTHPDYQQDSVVDGNV
mmetsp:Transcript_32801/g.37524  ORF Transcript_32801/g.37524 Transcript_32801/m.37524 type:complete len:604 (-) Transcript_32801:204-2015(-)